MTGCFGAPEAPNYSDLSNWAYFETDTTGKAADVFFICPTVYSGADQAYNMQLRDEGTKADFLGAINMEKDIYDNGARFFAPYYRQVGLNAYEMNENDREAYLDEAFSDVWAAFEYYLDNVNDGRPIILAGFSQGADMCIRLLKEYFADEQLRDQLVACYAIGWRLTEEETEKYPHLRPAQGEDDTGVIISFNSEAEEVVDSLLVPKGSKTLSINPLNWRTDSVPADKGLNDGAYFTDYSGNIVSEVPALTGAYIDPVRGTLKVTDVRPEDYPSGLDLFPNGVYHLDDYQFFYRNLQENVRTRLAAYLSDSMEVAA